MSKPTVGMMATPIVVKQPGENASKKNTVASKFFKQGKNIRTRTPSNMSRKYKNNNTIPKSHLERMVCSEDVSRKKKAKFSMATKFTTNISSDRDNIENDGDILESLITHFHKDYSKQFESQSENQHKKKLSSKPKTLFNEESIKLINDFKEFLREKEKADGDNVDMEFPKQNNSSMPFNDTSNSQYDRGTVYHVNDIIQNNGSSNHLQFNSSQRDLIDMKTINEKVPTYYPPQFINIQGKNPQSFDMRSDMKDGRSISQIQIPDTLSFVTTVVDSADDNDRMTRYPTPPLIYSPQYMDN